MDWAELRDLVDHHVSGVDVAVELYTRRAVRSGQVSCPVGARLSDLLNDAVRGERTVRTAFLSFRPDRPGGSAPSDQPETREFVRKSAIDLVAVADADAGKVTAGVAAQDVGRYLEKSPARITLEVGRYTLIGDMHRAPGETVEDVLNAGTPFLPLTGVTMVRDNLMYGTRPFIAVNKREVVSCREESPG